MRSFMVSLVRLSTTPNVKAQPENLLSERNAGACAYRIFCVLVDADALQLKL